MNTEVTAVVEKKIEETGEESSCTECVFVELGQVTEETKGGPGFFLDGGVAKQF